jgi:TonB family protein
MADTDSSINPTKYNHLLSEYRGFINHPYAISAIIVAAILLVLGIFFGLQNKPEIKINVNKNVSEDLKAQVTTIKNENQGYKEQARKADSTIQELQENIQSIQEEITVLQGENDDLKRENETLVSEISTKEETIEITSITYSQILQEIESLELIVIEQKELIEQTNNKLTIAETKIEELENIPTSDPSINEPFVAENKRLKEEIKKLETIIMENDFVGFPESPTLSPVTIRTINKLNENVIFKKEPSYPKNAQRKGIEGQCLVRFSINQQGYPTNVESNCTNKAFESNSKRAVEQFIFKPGDYGPTKHLQKITYNI